MELLGYDAASVHCCAQLFPDEELPELRTSMTDLYKSAIACSLKILEAMGHALQLKARKDNLSETRRDF